MYVYIPYHNIVTPTAKTRPQKLQLWRDPFHRISWNRKIHVYPLPEAIISFCACFDKVVRPRQDILEQKSNCYSTELMSKDQKRQTLLQGFNTRNWTEAVFYNNSSANISPQLSEPTDIYIQSRPTPSEPLFICPPFH